VILQLILPKISNTVANWNPYTDPVRVDTWITPWIPILGRSNMSLMITQIRQMLKSSLAEWEAGDTSAFIMIEPWKDVWSGAEWDQFVMQAVVPKLAFYLKNLSVPTDSVSSKTLEPIQNWVNHVPIGAINRMLIDFFFPNMLAIVRGWVRSPTVRMFTH
jgi:tuftelin-interacting protein 11